MASSALDERPPIAIVPRGTGWDFVRTFGIPRNVEQAARVALAGNEREVDLGLVTYRAWAGDEARAAFANVASAGMSGAIAARANETTKALGGKASYLWATFRVFAALVADRGPGDRRRRAARGADDRRRRRQRPLLRRRHEDLPRGRA